MRCVIPAFFVVLATSLTTVPVSALDGRYVVGYEASPTGRYVDIVERIASPVGRYINLSEDVARESAPTGRYVRAPYSLPALLDASLMPLGATVQA